MPSNYKIPYCTEPPKETLFDLEAVREDYEFTPSKKTVSRIIRYKGKVVSKTSIKTATGTRSGDPAASFDASWLQAIKEPHPQKYKRKEISFVDLFSGGGGLSLGFREAIKAFSCRPNAKAAFDTCTSSLGVYGQNFENALLKSDPIDELFQNRVSDTLSSSEKSLMGELGSVDVLLAGPPCQGHSDLNNHSRRNDSKNNLFYYVARAAKVLDPKLILIENVIAVEHDRGGVLQRTEEELNKLGYNTDVARVNGLDLGMPQGRRRTFVVASSEYEPDLQLEIRHLLHDARPVGWAIKDLVRYKGEHPFDTPARSSEINQARIQYLFDNNIFDLPNKERPKCHQNGHNYPAVYGRMHWDKPAPTITRGFGSNGQGRFVHPKKPRTLTPHEAARVQGFPDWFTFNGANRKTLQHVIGNAVHSKMAYSIGLATLRSL